MADQVAANGPLSTQAILRAWRETEGLPDAEAMQIQDKIGWEVFASEDAQEGPGRSRRSDRRSSRVGDMTETSVYRDVRRHDRTRSASKRWVHMSEAAPGLPDSPAFSHR